MKDLTITKTITSYLELDEPDETWETQLAAVSASSLLSQSGDFDLKFNLLDNKTGAVTSDGTEFEQYESDPQDPDFSSEDADVWRAFLNNETLLNSNGDEKPMIITTFIFESTNFNFEQTKFTGDSVYLNLTGGGTQEFVIGSISSNNPLVDFNSATEGPPTFNSLWFLSDFWAERVNGLSELKGRSNIFLAKTNDAVVNNVISAEVVSLFADQFAFNIIDEATNYTLLEQMYDDGQITIEAMRILADDEYELFSMEFRQRVRSLIR